MRFTARVGLALVAVLVWDWAPQVPPFPVHSIAQVQAQPISPPNAWHPYRGGKNCIQVADASGLFNCAAGTTVDPATGNLNISGSITFGAGGAAFAPGGLALTTLTTAVQLLGSGDLVLGTSGPTIAPSGPLIRGVTIRSRAVAGGSCQLVVAGGNGFAEFVIPVMAASIINPSLIANPNMTSATFNVPLLAVFPGGPLGC